MDRVGAGTMPQGRRRRSGDDEDLRPKERGAGGRSRCIVAQELRSLSFAKNVARCFQTEYAEDTERASLR